MDRNKSSPFILGPIGSGRPRQPGKPNESFSLMESVGQYPYDDAHQMTTCQEGGPPDSCNLQGYDQTIMNTINIIYDHFKEIFDEKNVEDVITFLSKSDMIDQFGDKNKHNYTAPTITSGIAEGEVPTIANSNAKSFKHNELHAERTIPHKLHINLERNKSNLLRRWDESLGDEVINGTVNHHGCYDLNQLRSSLTSNAQHISHIEKDNTYSGVILDSNYEPQVFHNDSGMNSKKNEHTSITPDHPHINENVVDATDENRTQKDTILSDNAKEDTILFDHSKEDTILFDHSKEDTIPCNNPKEDTLLCHNPREDITLFDNSKEDTALVDNSKEDTTLVDNSKEDTILCDNSKERDNFPSNTASAMGPIQQTETSDRIARVTKSVRIQTDLSERVFSITSLSTQTNNQAESFRRVDSMTMSVSTQTEPFQQVASMTMSVSTQTEPSQQVAITTASISIQTDNETNYANKDCGLGDSFIHTKVKSITEVDTRKIKVNTLSESCANIVKGCHDDEIENDILDHLQIDKETSKYIGIDLVELSGHYPISMQGNTDTTIKKKSDEKYKPPRRANIPNIRVRENSTLQSSSSTEWPVVTYNRYRKGNTTNKASSCTNWRHSDRNNETICYDNDISRGSLKIARKEGKNTLHKNYRNNSEDRRAPNCHMKSSKYISDCEMKDDHLRINQRPPSTRGIKFWKGNATSSATSSKNWRISHRTNETSCANNKLNGDSLKVERKDVKCTLSESNKISSEDHRATNYNVKTSKNNTENSHKVESESRKGLKHKKTKTPILKDTNNLKSDARSKTNFISLNIKRVKSLKDNLISIPNKNNARRPLSSSTSSSSYSISDSGRDLNKKCKGDTSSKASQKDLLSRDNDRLAEEDYDKIKKAEMPPKNHTQKKDVFLLGSVKKTKTKSLLSSTGSSDTNSACGKDMNRKCKVDKSSLAKQKYQKYLLSHDNDRLADEDLGKTKLEKPSPRNHAEKKFIFV